MSGEFADIGNFFSFGLLLWLVFGVVVGLLVGAIPGVGTLVALTILLPFSYGMEAEAAIVVAIGIMAVVNTSDTVPAVVFGIPGSTGAIATTIDGHAMAQNNKASEALGAAYSASLIGGLFGALVLLLFLPVMRSLILTLRVPDILAINLIGLYFISYFGGDHLIKGALAVLGGFALSFIGIDPHTGTDRWTYDQVGLWNGLSITPIVFGIFVFPQLVKLWDYEVEKNNAHAQIVYSGVLSGIKSTLKHPRLVLQSSGLGVLLGMLPGINLAITTWIAYAVGNNTTKINNTFGSGDIRGVIAPEAANNATEGGGLIPTLALGIPGGKVVAIFLSILVIHGFQPGLTMLTENASVIILIVGVLALSNVVGAAFCLGLTPFLIGLTRIERKPLFAIVIATIVTVAVINQPLSWIGFQLVCFCIIGFLMQRYNWPRAAFVIAFVLGPLVETNFLLALQIYGWEAFKRPSLAIIIAFFILMLVVTGMKFNQNRLETAPDKISFPALPTFLIATSSFILIAFPAWEMPFQAGAFPLTIGIGFGVVTALMLVHGAMRQLWSVPAIAQWRDWATFVILISSIAGLCIGSSVVGPILASLIFVFVLVGTQSQNGIIATLAYSLLLPSVLYFFI